MVPTEQALSMAMYTGHQLELSDAGNTQASKLLRILTPLLKFRTCRDNIKVATDAMEIRGGNGYIEDWVNSRLVRDAHLGVLWEGTSNINALDVTTRAIAKAGAHKALSDSLQDLTANTPDIPGQFRGTLQLAAERALTMAEEIATSGNETMARKASDALYHVTSASLLAREGAQLGTQDQDARRLILARMVIDHRLSPRDPLAIPQDEDPITVALLAQRKVSLAEAQELVAN